MINRVANKLRNRTRTAVNMIANFSNEIAPEYQAHYRIGRRYGGEAKRTIKSFVKPFSKGNRQNNNNYNSNFRSRKLRWLRGIMGCFVCHKEGHMVNQRHNEEEDEEAIGKLKSLQTTEVLTGEDLSYVADLLENDDTDHPY